MLLLSDPAKSITEMPGAVGFDNPDYFAPVFKKETGEAPTQIAIGVDTCVIGW